LDDGQRRAIGGAERVRAHDAHRVSLQAILDALVQRIVGWLPVSGAGVTLISDGDPPRYIAASDPLALRFERLQTTLGHGPCVAAHRTNTAVLIPDLAADEQFPAFAPHAAAAGLLAVFTFPCATASSARVPWTSTATRSARSATPTW
jgi:hypothetical protein